MPDFKRFRHGKYHDISTYAVTIYRRGTLQHRIYTTTTLLLGTFQIYAREPKPCLKEFQHLLELPAWLRHPNSLVGRDATAARLAITVCTETGH